MNKNIIREENNSRSLKAFNLLKKTVGKGKGKISPEVAAEYLNMNIVARTMYRWINLESRRLHKAFKFKEEQIRQIIELSNTVKKLNESAKKIIELYDKDINGLLKITLYRNDFIKIVESSISKEKKIRKIVSESIKLYSIHNKAWRGFIKNP